MARKLNLSEEELKKKVASFEEDKEEENITLESVDKQKSDERFSAI